MNWHYLKEITCRCLCVCVRVCVVVCLCLYVFVWCVNNTITRLVGLCPGRPLWSRILHLHQVLLPHCSHCPVLTHMDSSHCNTHTHTHKLGDLVCHNNSSANVCIQVNSLFVRNARTPLLIVCVCVCVCVCLCLCVIVSVCSLKIVLLTVVLLVA